MTDQSDAYDRNDPKSPTWRGLRVCALCGGTGGHYSSCPEIC
jgi:hypothetical protein